MSSEILSRQLALWRLPGIGPAALSQLQQYDPTFECFFKKNLLSNDLYHCLPKIARTLTPDWRSVENDFNWLALPEHHLLQETDPHYPELLRSLSQAPPFLFIDGSVDNLQSPQIAIVGSRKPTPSGQEHAFLFSSELAQIGLTVTSGLALGIDAACHEAAVSVKKPTIGILGSGIDIIYPSEHRSLVQRIKREGGSVVSEFPTGIRPLPQNFPRRNRIISGLSLGVLVVEAALKSGSLITAYTALAQGREVFAVPGPILSPLSEGCHTLIQQGAKLVMRVPDILEEIGWKPSVVLKKGGASSYSTSTQTNPYSGERGLIWQAVDNTSCTPIDQVIHRTGLPVAQVSRELLALVANGALEAVPGGYVRTSRKES